MIQETIHSTAVIAPSAQLAEGVVVGPYAVIGPNVKIGRGTQIHAHALITGHTTLGEDNQVFSFASIGNAPQDLKYKGEPTTLVIGNRNLIREYVTLQPGTVQGLSTTIIGDENLFMAYVHVAHDCIVGHQNVFANGAQLAGHVIIGNQAVLGGLSAIHQHCVVGDMAMTGGGTMLNLDVPPYCMVEGQRGSLSVRGLNLVALQRRGLKENVRASLKTAYKTLLVERHASVEIAIAQLPASVLECQEVQNMIAFIRGSKRGVVRHQVRGIEDE